MANPRGIDPTVLAAIEDGNAELLFLLEFRIDEGSPEDILRLHTGVGTISYDSNDWLGVGDLLSIDTVQDSLEMKPSPFVVSLSGLNSDITDLVFGTKSYYRRPAIFYIAAHSEGAMIGTPSILFSGFIEKLDMELAGDRGDVITANCENEFILFKRSRNVRYSDRQMQTEYPGDLGFEFLQAVLTSNVVWRGQRNGLGVPRGDPTLRPGDPFQPQL
jgi:hypothetical protein